MLNSEVVRGLGWAPASSSARFRLPYLSHGRPHLTAGSLGLLTVPRPCPVQVSGRYCRDCVRAEELCRSLRVGPGQSNAVPDSGRSLSHCPNTQGDCRRNTEAFHPHTCRMQPAPLLFQWTSARCLPKCDLEYESTSQAECHLSRPCGQRPPHLRTPSDPTDRCWPDKCLQEQVIAQQLPSSLRASNKQGDGTPYFIHSWSGVALCGSTACREKCSPRCCEPWVPNIRAKKCPKICL